MEKITVWKINMVNGLKQKQGLDSASSTTAGNAAEHAEQTEMSVVTFSDLFLKGFRIGHKSPDDDLWTLFCKTMEILYIQRYIYK